MGELERLLRDYGHDADEVVRPVTMNDLGSRPVLSADVPSAQSTRVWRGPGLTMVAACVVLAVGLGFVLGRMSAPQTVEEVPPAESPQSDPSVPDALVTLPEPAPPDPVDEVMETSIGSISWTRVEGDRTALPRRVVGRDGSTLIGDDWDPMVSWVSTDGGESWRRSQTDGVRSRAGGHEWIRRDGEDGQSSLSRVTADREIDVAVEPSIADVPDGWNLTTYHSDPIDIGGEAFVLTRSFVRADLEAVAAELGVTRLAFPGGSIHFFDDERDTGAVSSEIELRLVPATQPGSRMVDLVDPDGEIVATFDAGIGALDDVDPATLVAYGRAVSQWTVFDGEEFAALDVPWTKLGYTTMVSVGDSVMAVNSPQLGPPTTDSPYVSLWTTTDGRTWVDVTPDVPERSTTWTVDITETDGAIIVGLGGNWFFTRDGHTFESLSTRPMTDQRARSDVGWVALAGGAYTMWVSPDGDDWESHRITGLHELGYPGSALSGGINIIDSTIYIIVDSGLDDHRAALLIGEVTPGP